MEILSSVQLNLYSKFDLPELSPDAAQWRLESNALGDLRDQVASTDDGHDPETPAELADQILEIETEEGSGRLLFAATKRLNGAREYPEVEEIYIVTHGEIRNVKDYIRNYAVALGASFDPKRTLIIAPQFNTQFDDIDDTILRYGVNEWRAGEPALAPSPRKKSPLIDSYTAKDELIYWAWEHCPNVRAVRLRNNSEGGQMDDRYIAWSMALQKLEMAGITVEGLIQNAGSFQLWDEKRLQVDNFRREGRSMAFNVTESAVAINSLANRWPVGLFDPKDPRFDALGPPPYVRRSMQKFSVQAGLEAYRRRAGVVVGLEDKDSRASRLPIGVGFDEQGRNRVARAVHKVLRTDASDPTNVSFERLVTVDQHAHDALALFLAIARYRSLSRAA